MAHLPPFPSRDDVITTQAPRNRFTKRIADWLQAVVDSVETLDTRASSLVAQDAALLMADVALVAAVAALQPTRGDYVPSLLFGGAAVGMTYSRQQGYFVKTGRLVHAAVRISLTAKGSSAGQATISLPFPYDQADGENIHPSGVMGYGVGFAGLTSPPTFWLTGTLAILTHWSATQIAGLTEAHFTNTTDLLFSCEYRTPP